MFSCTDDDDPIVPQTVDQKLVGSWKVTAATINPAIDLDGDSIAETTDIYNSILFSVCDKDDLTIYSSDYTYKEDEGATKCDPSDPQISETGTWGLNSTKTMVTHTHSGIVDPPIVIVSLTSTTLTASTTDASFPGYTISFTMAKQ